MLQGWVALLGQAGVHVQTPMVNPSLGQGPVLLKNIHCMLRSRFSLGKKWAQWERVSGFLIFLVSGGRQTGEIWRQLGPSLGDELWLAMGAAA